MINKKARVIYLIYSVCLSVVFQVLFSYSSDAIAQKLGLFICTFFFLLPFAVNIVVIHNYEIGKTRRFVLWDCIYVVAPSLVASTLAECALFLINRDIVLSGLGTLILFGIIFIMALISWIIYSIINSINSRP